MNYRLFTALFGDSMSSRSLKVSRRGNVLRPRPTGFDTDTHENRSCDDQGWPESLFQTATPLLFQKIFNPDPEIFQTWESDSFSDCGYQRSNPNLPMLLLKKWQLRLLLLLKLKSDSGFTQIFDSGYAVMRNFRLHTLYTSTE